MPDFQPLVPPPYLFASPASPAYTSRAASSEFVLLSSRAVAVPDFQTIAQLTFSDSHQTSSKHLMLNLGPRLYHVDLPAYGLGASVEGFVEIKKHEHVSRVTLTIESQATTKHYDRGLAIEHKSIDILSLVHTIYSRPSRSSEPLPPSPKRYPFSIALPKTTLDGSSPLPPSFIFTQGPQMDANVNYIVRVDMVRKGLRMHDSVRMPILYLPRSTPPPPSPDAWGHRMSLSTALDTKTRGIDCKFWKTFQLDPKQPLAVSAEVTLPRPLIYAANYPIPFIIVLLCPPSPVGQRQDLRQQFLIQPITVQLLKVTRISAGKGANSREAVLAKGDVWRDRECEVYTQETRGEGIRRVVRGTLQGGRAGGEMSWFVKNLIQVKYLVRISVKSTSPEFWPSFEHDEQVELTSHEWERLGRGGTDLPDSRPALALRSLRHHSRVMSL